MALSLSGYVLGADYRFAPSQWETALLCNDVSHWLGANLVSALCSLCYDNMRSKNNHTRNILLIIIPLSMWTLRKADDPKQYGISIFLCGYFVGKKTVKPDGVHINITINPSKIAILFAANFNAINPRDAHVCQWNVRCQAITWSNACRLVTRLLWTKFGYMSLLI